MVTICGVIIVGKEKSLLGHAAVDNWSTYTFKTNLLIKNLCPLAH